MEAELTRPAFTPRTAKAGKPVWMILPYRIGEKSMNHRYAECEMKEKFPKAYAHLFKSRDALESRALDSSASWFEYGRNQGLDVVCQNKLILSTIITHRVFVYELKKGDIPFGGIVITANSDQCDLADAKAILESDAFYQYALNVGTRVNGVSVRITCKDIENYHY